MSTIYPHCGNEENTGEHVLLGCPKSATKR